MTYDHLRALHALGLILLFLAFGGLVVVSFNHGQERVRGYGLCMATHGLGMLLLLGSGIAIMYRPEAGIEGLPLWILVKIVLWLVLGTVVMVVKRAPRSALLMWVLLPLLGGIAALLGIHRGLGLG